MSPNLNDDGYDVLQSQPMGGEEMTDMTDILAYPTGILDPYSLSSTA